MQVHEHATDRASDLKDGGTIWIIKRKLAQLEISNSDFGYFVNTVIFCIEHVHKHLDKFVMRHQIAKG